MEPRNDDEKKILEELMKALEASQQKKIKPLLSNYFGLHILYLILINLVSAMAIVGLLQSMGFQLLVETKIVSFVIFIVITTFLEVLMKGLEQLIFKKKTYFTYQFLPVVLLMMAVWVLSFYLIPHFKFFSFFRMIVFLMIYFTLRSAIVFYFIRKRFIKNTQRRP